MFDGSAPYWSLPSTAWPVLSTPAFAAVRLVEGVMHRPQPDSTIARLRKAVEAQGPFELAGFSPLVTISGSLVLALALAENAIDPGSAWDAATLDEQWQIEQWGEDAEALRALESRRAEFDAANRLLKML